MTTTAIILVYAAAWIFIACIGAACGASRNRASAGFWITFFIGPVGWIIALLLPSTHRYRQQRRRVRCR